MLINCTSEISCSQLPTHQQNSSFYLSMKRPAVHTFVSNWKHRPGSDCTCWATALKSFPHRSLSSSPERQQPRPTVVQQPPSQCRSIPVPPSSHPRHINFLGIRQFQVIHIVVLVLKASSLLVSHLIENRPSERLACCTFITAWAHKLHVSLWVASWEGSMALRLIFTKNKHRDKQNESKRDRKQR